MLKEINKKKKKKWNHYLVRFKMHSEMRIGSPVLRVKNIDRILRFYEERLGLHVNRRYYQDGNDDDDDGGGGGHNLVCELGSKQKSMSNEPILILQHDPDAKNAPHRSAGLYHFAILVPDRKSLASTYLAVRNSGVRFDGFADHLVSESLYLRDPENNGIEIYRDRQASEWSYDSEGHIKMDTLPLDLNSLVSELNKEEERKTPKAFPTGSRIGHMHIRVTNLERSIKFYYEKIGLDITSDWISMGAAFLSAGGYHHHIGMNTWNSLNGIVHGNDEVGLENFTISIPDRSSFNTIKSIINHHASSEQQKADKNQLIVSDPDGIQIVIKSE
jgi:catechol 2,3-dioxygenase